MKNLDARPLILCLMGPTAVGKSALAIELVKHFPFEIISVDSALVYREMDIGTAKPDLATRQRVPHRLIDILDPTEAYSAGRFRVDAMREIAEVQTAGRIPLLVGGTMLYFRALEQGLAELPPADAVVRARLGRELAERGSESLHARLAQLDPTAARRIHPRDPQRIQRALEVYELSGQSLTELWARSHTQSLLFNAIKLVVMLSDRRLLHERIERRFHTMLEQGFVTEVERLRARGDLDAEKPSMRAVGYRQIWAYLNGDLHYAQMVDQGIIATRQFAKRQLTWLRGERDGIYLDGGSNRLLDHVVTELRKHGFFPNLLEGLC